MTDVRARLDPASSSPGAASGRPESVPVAGGPIVVIDEADLVAGLHDLRAGVVAMVRSGSRRLVVDVSRLRALSSTTVTGLLWAQRRCRARGGEVVLRGANRRLRRGLRDSGLRHSFRIEGDGESQGAQPGNAVPRSRGATG